MSAPTLLKILKSMLIVFIIFSGRTGVGIEVPLFPFYVGIIGMMGLVVCILAEKVQVGISKTNYYALLVIFTIMLLIGNFQNPSEYGYMKTVEFFIYILLFIVLVDLSIKDKNDLLYLIKSIYYVALIMAIIALFQGVVNGTLTSGRLTFLNSGPNTFSRILFLGYIANLYLIFNSKKLLYYLPSIWIFLSTIYFSGARQTILGAIFFTLLYLIINYFINGRKFKLIVFVKYSVLICTLLIPIVALWPQIQQNPLFQRFMLLFQDDKGDSVSARFWLLEEAMALGKQSFLFGNGTGSFNSYFPDYKYPHNIFAEIFAENGIVALIWVVIICLYPIIKGISHFKYLQNTQQKSFLLATLMLYLFSVYTAQISGDLFDNRWIFIFGFLFIKSNLLMRGKAIVYANSDAGFIKAVPINKRGNFESYG